MLCHYVRGYSDLNARNLRYLPIISKLQIEHEHFKIWRRNDIRYKILHTKLDIGLERFPLQIYYVDTHIMNCLGRRFIFEIGLQI
jgi:hypothetical protein